MKLTYRGVEYKEENQNFSISAAGVDRKEIIYRGNSLKARINPKFPWSKYIKQLFYQSKPVFDPIRFWYDHKRKFLKDCWSIEDFETLDRAWDLTIRIERIKNFQPKHKTQLKYRGVTYYR